MTLADHQWGISRSADRVWAQVCGMRPSMAAGRKFMVLQAYIDESIGTDGSFVLAGYISTAERWANFSREWEKALPLAWKHKSGRHDFKMSQMAMSPSLMQNVGIFHNIINRHAIMGVAFYVNISDISKAKKRISIDYIDEIAWAGDVFTDYFFAFRIFMDVFHKSRVQGHEWLAELGNEPVDFYFDNRDVEKKVVIGMWNDFMNNISDDERRMYGATPRFEKDEEFLALQAADFIAWWTRKWCQEGGGIAGAEHGEYYGFKPSLEKIPNIYMSTSEDLIANFFRECIQNDNPFKVRDGGPLERIDAPFPVERAWDWAKGRVSSFFRWKVRD